MKKKFYYAAMFAAGLMTISTSCSNEDEIINEGENSEVATGEQVIVLDMQDTDVLSTKSRPLYSTENKGAENVTDVQLLVFEHSENVATPMKLVKVLKINMWDKNSVDYNYGRKYSLKLEDGDKLEKGKSYTILAVGQDESNTSATDLAPYKIVAGNQAAAWINADWSTLTSSSLTWNASSNVSEGFLLTEDGRTSTTEAEIFSGISKPVTLQFDGGFTTEVLLKRQVAGVLGYFSKIPAMVRNEEGDGSRLSQYDAVKKIRLVASTKNTRIDLTHALGNQKDDATEVGKENVVNGFDLASADAKYNEASTDNAYTVYEIDLAQWFKPANSNAVDGSYWYNITSDIYYDEAPTLGSEFKYSTTNIGSKDQTATTTWVNAFDQANDNPRVATNSVLAGRFVIPFEVADNVNVNTFELQLIGGADDSVLKSWNVKLDEMSIDQTQGDSEYVFNIYRNHLYQIGQRGNGDDPTNPGTDPDKPQPLDKDQELTIKINDQWEFIHDLEID